MIHFFENKFLYYPKGELLKSIERWRSTVSLSSLIEGNFYQLDLKMNNEKYIGQFEMKVKGKTLGSTDFRFKVKDGHILINQSNIDLYEIYTISYSKESNLIYQNFNITINDGSNNFKLTLYKDGTIGVFKRK